MSPGWTVYVALRVSVTGVWFDAPFLLASTAEAAVRAVFAE
jgi:hypothetical protein